MTKQEKLNVLNNRCEYNKYNGIVVTDIEPERCVVEGELRPQALNPLGMAHGGFVYSLCDVAAGVVAGQRGSKCVTLSSSMNYFHPSKGTKLRCEGIIVKSGRTVSVVDTVVYDDTGRLAARGSFEIFHMSDPSEAH